MGTTYINISENTRMADAEECWPVIHPHLRTVAHAMVTTTAPQRMSLGMDSTGGVQVRVDGLYLGGCYYYGSNSGWIVIRSNHPTEPCGSLAECLALFPEDP